MDGEAQILIVGGGPVGLILSLALARFGVRSLVLESRVQPTPRDESRAITWQPRGIEMLEWLGIVEEIADRAVRRTRHEFWVAGREALTLHFDRVDSLHPYTLDLPQGDSESVIEAAARATGLVEIRRGHKALEIDAWDGVARVQVKPDGEDAYVVEAPWGAICDGYHSPMRKALGIGFKHRDYGADSVVADFESTAAILPEGASNIVLDARRPYGFFRFGTDRWRIIYRINPGESREDMTRPERILRLVQELAPAAEAHKLLWASAFRLGQQQSDSFRKGRWILVGDAAHGMGPSAGAGLQVGALGAWRLSWRLALAAQGHQGVDTLLNDFGREQRAAADQVQTNNELIFRNLALRSPLLSAMRVRVLQLVGRLPALTTKLANSTALVAQHVPARHAHDWTAELPLSRPIASHRDWKMGCRAPLSVLRSCPHLRNAGRMPTHVVFPVSGGEAGRLARAIADTSPVPANAVSSYIPESGANIVAIIRPDQEVAALLKG